MVIAALFELRRSGVKPPSAKLPNPRYSNASSCFCEAASTRRFFRELTTEEAACHLCRTLTPIADAMSLFRYALLEGGHRQTVACGVLPEAVIGERYGSEEASHHSHLHEPGNLDVGVLRLHIFDRRLIVHERVVEGSS